MFDSGQTLSHETEATPQPAEPFFPLAARELTVEEQERLGRDTDLVSAFKQQKLEAEAQRNWDLFYKRNTTKFFKDRHWTIHEFKELCNKKASGSALVILEVGCGVGNFVFPLLEEDPTLFFYACDFSPRAVKFVQENPLYTEERCHAFQCDITTDALSEHVQRPVDLVTVIFVLSAIHPDKMRQALENVAEVLPPGGRVLFRDYGIYDHAMLRFSRGHKLAEQFYVRQDGTRAYYFYKDELSALFASVGLVTIQCDYVLRELVNKREGISVPRVFVQGCFQKPHPTDGATDGMSHGACAACQNVDEGHDRGAGETSSVDNGLTRQPEGSDLTDTDSHQIDDGGDVTNRTDDDRNVSSGVVVDEDSGDRLNLTDDDKLHEIT